MLQSHFKSSHAVQEKSIVDELEYVNVNFEQDLDYAYWNFFKPGIEDCVRDLNKGEWPESRYDFFKSGFSDPDMMMIMHKGERVGCYCIRETENEVILQRVYIAQEYQRQGIGQSLIAMSLQVAHEKSKPLELEVLANNKKAINSYSKAGFIQTTPVLINGWNQKFSMRHKDTFQYMPMNENKKALALL